MKSAIITNITPPEPDKCNLFVDTSARDRVGATARTPEGTTVSVCMKQSAENGCVIVDINIDGMYVVMTYCAGGSKFVNIFDSACKYVNAEITRDKAR